MRLRVILVPVPGSYLVSFASRKVEITTYLQRDGKIEQYLVLPHE